jgi:hypothetical protein
MVTLFSSNLRSYQCNIAKLPGKNGRLTSFSTLEKMSSFMALSLIKSRVALAMHATRVTLTEERGYVRSRKGFR